MHHRSGATSDRLGVFRRGFLFERNALLTAYTNLDEEQWPRLMPAIWLTFLTRVEALLVAGDPAAALLRADPFADRLAEEVGAAAAGAAGDAVVVRQTLAQKLEQHGLSELVRRGVRRIGRKLAVWGEPGGRGERFRVDHPQAISHLRAASLFLRALDGGAARRVAVQARRRRPDHELFARFPLYLVPTYPGDARWFASPGFASLLPADLPLVRATLGDVMEWSGEEGAG